MSNLTPEDVNLRLTKTRDELQLEDTRLWQGLEDERVSRIAGDAANNNLIENANTALAAQESRLSVEVVQREEGDLRNISSLTELAQALAAYRIKTDLEINNEKIARQQLGVDLNYRIDVFTATFDHQFLMVYQAIQDYQNDTDSTLSLFDDRITRYEQMLQDITTDSIQITMDNGEINMGAWTILSQARQWDLEILGKFKNYQTTTKQSIDDALQDIQKQLPLEETIVSKAIEALSQAPAILELDSKLNSSIQNIDTIQANLLAEIDNRQSEMIAYSQTIANQMQTNQAALVSMVEAESAARIDRLQREANIRQQELMNEAIERSAEIDEKLQDALGNLNVDLSGVYSEINQVSAALDAEEAARIAAITDLNNGLTKEIQLRQDGDTANLTAINNYKIANDAALANVRSGLQANVTATAANASNITALDTRLVANESLAASAVNKAETALTQNSAMASEISSVKASITDLEDSLVDKADANALQLLDSKVTVIDGKVTANTSDITQLKTNVTTLTNTKADATALNALTNTVATQGNTITSQSKDISDLTAAISTSVPEIKFTGTQDCINITSAYASNPDVTLVTEPSAVSGKVVRIGNNAGSDMFVGIMNSYVAIDPTKLYRVKYRIRRVLNDAASIYLALVQTNATKTLNVMSSNGTKPLNDISNSLYFVLDAKPALGTWLTGEYYFKGKSAGASSGVGTLASPRTFAADAAFFRIGILPNYLTASGTQDVDYIIVEDYDAMALGNANAAATTALTARVTSAEGTLTSNSTAITQLQNSLTVTNNTVARKADASAVNALDSKVTTMGSTVTSNSNAITQLQNDLTATNAAVSTKASAAALTALDTKVTTVDSKVTTQGTQITTLNNNLTVTDKLTRLTSQGKPLRDDANFKTGASLSSYNAQTGYTLTRQPITAGNPSGSTHEYRMAMTQAITGIGIGFYANPYGIATAASKVFLFKMVLKAPVGAVINIYKNVTGTPTTYEMLGNNLGTGKFETYYFWLQCGSTGTFSTAGHVAISQGTSTVGTVETPWEAFIASYEVWDVTTVDDSIPKIWADKVDANATAVTSLNSQVTSINGAVTSQGSQLTTLANRVSTVEGSVANKADSSAVSSLDSKVTTLDGKVTSQGSSITKLQSGLAVTNSNVDKKADAAALSTLDTKVTAQGNDLATNANQITQLSADINNVNLRGQDLVSNGLGQLQSNKYWSALTFTAMDKPAGVGSFVSRSGQDVVIGDEFIAVDPVRSYKLAYYMRQTVPGVAARGYGMIAPYDVDKLPIAPIHYMVQANTLTTLAVPLKKGDTTMTLTSAANWYNLPNTNTHLRSAIFWNYTDSTGYTWPANTYSRNVWLGLYNGGAINGNVITLNNPWDGPEIPVGTQVSNGSAGGTYMYIGAVNQIIPQEWTAYSGVFAGIHTNTLVSATNKLPMMTAYIKIGFLFNRTDSGSNNASSRMAVGGVSIRDWSVVEDPSLAKATALAATNTEVSRINGVVIAQGTSITNLQSNLSTVSNTVASKADATALQALDSRVTTVEGTVTTQSSSINKLQNALAVSAVASDNLLTKSNIVGNYSYGKYPHHVYTGYENIVVGATYTLLVCWEHKRGAGDTNSVLAVYAAGGSQQVATLQGDTAGSGKVVSKFTFVKNSSVTVGHEKAILFYMLNQPTNDKGSIGTVYWAVLVRGSNINTDRWIPSKYDLSTDVVANSTAIQTLDSEVNTLEGNVASNTSAITTLDNRVTTAEGNITATSNALTGLTSRVTAAEGNVSTQSNQITTLNNNLAVTTNTANAALPKVTSSNNSYKLFRGVLAYDNNTVNLAGNIVIQTPITLTSKMFKVTGTGYNYVGNATDIRFTVGGYAFKATNIINHSATNTGSVPLRIRLGVRNGAVCIILTNNISGNLWQYPKINLDAEIGYTLPPDSWQTGWSAAVVLEADLASYGITGIVEPSLLDMKAEINANASALAALNNTVTQQGNTITSNSNQITSLNNSITTINNTLATKANSSAVSSLDSRVTTAEGKLTSLGNQTTTLNATLNSVVDVVTIKDTRNTNELPNWYWTNYPKRKLIEFKLASVLGLTNMGTYVSLETITPWTDASGGSIKQVARSGDELLAQHRYSLGSGTSATWSAWKPYLKELTDANTANASAISTLNSQVTSINGTLTAQSTSITKLEASATVSEIKVIGVPDALVGAVLYGTQTPNVSYETDNTAASNKVIRFGDNSGTDYTVYCNGTFVVIDPNKLYRMKYRYRRVAGDGGVYLFIQCANAEKTLNVTAGNTTLPLSTISAANYAVTNAKPALNTWVEGECFFKGKSTGASTGAGTMADPRTFPALAAYMRVGGLFNYNTGPGQQDLDYIMVEDYDAAKAAASNAAAITTLDTKVTTVDGKVTTQANSITQLQTSVAGNTSAIQVQGSSINGIQAEYTIKTDVNGLVAGIGLINSGTTSAVGINADYFYVGKPTTGKKPFMVLTTSKTIDGVTYPAGTWIDVALIANATIGTAHIADAAITNAKIATLDASKITTGVLNANRVRVGPTSTFDEGYNPTTKARTFVAQPTVPYSVGDIWKNGSSTYICKTARVAGSFTASEWDKVGDVTSENTAADSAKLGGTTASAINQSIATADSKAVTAQQAATNAATLAGNKGEVIFGATAPAAYKQLAQNLWIDTTGNANTPKRWNGSSWVVVTDKAATDAKAVADAADAKAAAADSKASAADNKATIAQATANSANNQVDAWKFTGTTEIDGGKIRADTVTAAQISVNELSAISGTIGTLRTKTSGSRLEIRDDIIEVFDENGVVRVQLGIF